MQVGVEEAIAERLMEQGRAGLGQNVAWIVARRDDALAFVDRDADHAFERQHALGRAHPIHLGHTEGRIVLEIFGQLRRRGGLEAQIHLHGDRVRHGLHHLDGAQAPHARAGALGDGGQPEEQAQIARESFLDAGPQDLDRDLAPIGRHRHMHLRDRGGGHGLFVELREEGFQRPAEFARDDGARLGAGERRQTVLQLRQVGGDVLAQQVRAGRENLAELDKAGSEPLDRQRQALTGAQGGDAPRPPREQARRGGYGRRDAEPFQKEQRVVLRQPMGDAEQADDVAYGTDHRIVRALLKPPGAVQRRDARGQVAVAHAVEAGLRDHAGEFLLGRKAPDAFGQIAVGVLVSGHHPSKRRQHGE